MPSVMYRVRSAVVAVGAGASCCVAAELHVPADYPTIQAAINAAVDGDEVIVAPGEYSEALNLLGKEIVVRGSGGAAVTTLDGGGLATTIVMCTSGETLATVIEGFTFVDGRGGALQNCTPRAGSGGAIYIRSSSLTVRGCDFVGNGVDRDLVAGGAICAFNGGLRVEACTFTENGGFTNNPDLGVTRGGAIYVCNPSSQAGLEIVDSVFSANRAETRGGGVYAEALGPISITGSTFEGNLTEYGAGASLHSDTAVTVEGCAFFGNSAAYGAGVDMLVSSAGDRGFTEQSVVRGCTFEGNSASFGAGLNINSTGRVLVEACGFIGNAAAFGGGLGMWVLPAEPDFPAPIAVVSGCTFDDNLAGFGGGLVGQVHMSDKPGVATPELHVVGSRFVRNEAANCCEVGVYSNDCGVRDGSNNGRFYGGGADLRTFYGGVIELVNCEVVGNDAVAAGGLHLASCGGGDIRVVNSTVAENGTSGVHLRLDEADLGQVPSALDVHNSVVWGNGGAAVDNLVVWNDGGPFLSSEVAYSNVEGGAAGVGNIDADPLFVDAGGGDYSLGAGSPSIDAGDNTRVPAGVGVDLAGNPRFVDDPGTADTGVPGGDGGALIVDMGALEFQGGGCRADVNGDGEVDTRDFITFLNAWAAGEPLADWNGDGVIDSRDVIAYLGAWAAGC